MKCVVALLLAGGEGLRLGADRPKQFLEVDGRSVLCITLAAFDNHPAVTDLCVVCPAQWAAYVREQAAAFGIRKPLVLASGGISSIDSLRNGLQAVAEAWGGESPQEVAVMVHDAVRPLVDEGVLTRNLEVYALRGNAISCIRSEEAYLHSADGIQSTEIIRRDLLWRAQTPMTFSLAKLQELMRAAEEKHITGSQSLITLVHEVLPDEPLYVALGSRRNFKITFPEDVRLLKGLIDLY